MKNFANTVIYKIHCKDETVTDIYVGHTTNLAIRTNLHRSHSKLQSKSHLRVYKCINEHGGFDNWTVTVVEKYPCETSKEANAREAYWQKELKGGLNMRIPNRDTKTYYKDNQALMTEKARAYYEAHKADVLKKRKTFYELNRERLKANILKRYNDKKAKMNA